MIDTDRYKITLEMLENMEHCFGQDPERDYNMWGLRINFDHEKRVKQYAELLIAEVKQLRKDLNDAEDVIAYALEMTSEDDAIAVFKDFLGVEE